MTEAAGECLVSQDTDLGGDDKPMLEVGSPHVPLPASARALCTCGIAVLFRPLVVSTSCTLSLSLSASAAHPAVIHVLGLRA